MGKDYKVAVYNYDDKNTYSGTTDEVSLPGENYFLLWEDNGNEIDTISSTQSFGDLFQKQKSDGSWYYPKWLVNNESKGVAGGLNYIHAYTAGNVTKGNTGLRLELRKNKNNEWESGCLYSNARFKYGYWEARVKMPNGKKRIFPTLWLFNGGCPPNNIGNYSEIDLCDFGLNANYRFGIGTFETLNQQDCSCKSQTSATLHPAMKKKNSWKRFDMSKDYFIYGVDWRPDSLVYYLNRNRIAAFQNNVNNSKGLRLILETKVVNGQKPTSSGTHFYQVDWVKYYKRDKEMNLILSDIPNQVCAGNNVEIVLKDFIPAAKIITTGISGSYTSPIASSLPPNNLPLNSISAFQQIPVYDLNPNNMNGLNDEWDNRQSWNPFLIIKIPLNTLPGKYVIRMDIPDVPDAFDPQKTIEVIHTIPNTPTDLSIVQGWTADSKSQFDCNCNIIVNGNGREYKWILPDSTVYSSPENKIDYNLSGRYSVSAVNACGTSGFISKDFTTCEGMEECLRIVYQNCTNCAYKTMITEEEKMTNILIFPNPSASNTLTIDLVDEIIASVRLIDEKGSVILSHFSNNSEVNIDISGLSKGIYIVEIETLERVYFKKCIKSN